MPSWSSEPNGTMSAMVLTNPSPDPLTKCFTCSHTYPRPSLPGPDWILCRVRAAGLNRAELRSRMGMKPLIGEFVIFRSEAHDDPPKILGEEFAGEVVDSGANTDFNPGQKVAGFIYGGGKAHDGSYAEYTLCHKRRLYHLPESRLSWNVLGAIPMSAWTAYGSLELAGRLSERPSHATVLIHGGTSSVGVWGILLAKAHGATVIATSRKPEKLARLKEAGADHAILEDKMEKEVLRLFPNGVDIIQELISPENVETDLRLLARRGSVVLVGILNMNKEVKNFQPFSIPSTRNVSFYTTLNMGAGKEDDGLENEMVEKVLREIIGKVEAGVYKPEIFLDRTFQLAEIAEAHAYMKENSAVGKIVVAIP